MLRRGRLLILLGLILAIITVGLAYYMLPKGPAPSEEVKIRTVVVAKRAIGEREEITPDAVGTEEREEKYIPENAITSPAQAVGKISMVPIVEGETILADMVVSKEEAKEQGELASLAIPPGKVAFAFPIEDRNSVAGAIQPGDFVDVLVDIKFDIMGKAIEGGGAEPGAGEAAETLAKTGEKAIATQLTLQDVEVLKVGLWTPPPVTTTEEGAAPPPPTQNYLTLLLNQQDALVILYLRDDPNVSVDFVLRASGDHEIVNIESVTLQYILTRFNVGVPSPPPTIGPE